MRSRSLGDRGGGKNRIFGLQLRKSVRRNRAAWQTIEQEFFARACVAPDGALSRFARRSQYFPFASLRTGVMGYACFALSGFCL